MINNYISIQLNIDVYKILNLDPSIEHSVPSVKEVYKALLKKTEQKQERQNIHFCYEIISNDIFYRFLNNGILKLTMDEGNEGLITVLAILKDKENLKKIIQKSGKQLLFNQDIYQRSLLYIATKYENFELAEYLIYQGINVNYQQFSGSTSLHCAAFYGYLQFVKLLTFAGTDIKILNQFENTCLIEAKTYIIKQFLINVSHSPLRKFISRQRKIFPNLKVKFTWDCEQLNSIYMFNPRSQVQQNKELKDCFHGTYLKNVASILKYGFYVAGDITPENIQIQKQLQRLNSRIEVKGMRNYSQAIFLSPSPFYAALDAYSESIEIDNRKMKVLIHCQIENIHCQFYSGTIVDYAIQPGEDEMVEIRIEKEKREYIKILGVLFINSEIIKQNSIENQNLFWKTFYHEPQYLD